MNLVLRASALLIVVGLGAPAVAATIGPVPVPTIKPVPPTFACSVSNIYAGELFTTATVTIVKDGGGPLAANANVVATIQIPGQKMTTSACGKQLVGTPPKVALSGVIVPPDGTKKAIYTCAAVVSGTCSTDAPPNPPK